MCLHFEPLLVEHHFQCRMPDAKSGIQRKPYLKRIVTVDVLWTEKRGHWIILIGLRHGESTENIRFLGEFLRARAFFGKK